MDTEYRIERYRNDQWIDAGEKLQPTFLAAKGVVESKDIPAPWRIVAIVPIMQCI